MFGIYIHIPFCRQACSYCDFYFVTEQSLRDRYVQALLNEIKKYRNTHFTDEPVETIYFGGGTPSRLSVDQIDEIISALRETFPTEAKEITLEMNPDDVSRDYLTGLQQAGITRASMGVQSFQPELLKAMNRAHNRVEALQSLDLLNRSNFKSYSVDLIYGNPGQTTRQLSRDLDLLLSFHPPHISAYSLTVEPKTRLGKQVELGRITPPEDETIANQFEMIGNQLSLENIKRYEVSNYSRPGREAQHNSNYWRHKNYLGFGPGAHSFWWNGEPGRWQNKADLRAYLKEEQPTNNVEQLSLPQLAEERIMMGLRTRAGITQDEMSKKYGYRFNERQLKYIKKQQDKGNLAQRDSIALTDKGLVIADAIILDLVTLQGQE